MTAAHDGTADADDHVALAGPAGIRSSKTGKTSRKFGTSSVATSRLANGSSTTTGPWSNYAVMARHVEPANLHLLDLLGDATGRLIDIGAGSGTGMEEAASRGWETVGVDVAVEQLANAAELGLSTIRCDARDLPLADASIDAAMSNFGLIFAADPVLALSEAHRVLEPDGQLTFTAWTPGGWPGPCRAVLAAAVGRTSAPFPTHLGDPDTARETLTRIGFDVVRVDAGVLRWRFADLDDAVDTLTAAAGGLRVLRDHAEAVGAWPAARDRLYEELAGRCRTGRRGLVLDDHYLAMLATRRCAFR